MLMLRVLMLVLSLVLTRLSSCQGATGWPWPSGYLRDAGSGLCAGCGDFFGGCANDVLQENNGSGHGLGMQACTGVCPQCAKNQQFNFSTGEGGTVGMLTAQQGGCLEVMPSGQVVLQQKKKCNSSKAQSFSQLWNHDSQPGSGEFSTLVSNSQPGMCLASTPREDFVQGVPECVSCCCCCCCCC